MQSPHTQQLSVGIVQPDTLWENKEDNLVHISQHISQMLDEHAVVDLVVLPEMFTTGFSMQPAHLAENMAGPSLAWMKSTAEENGIALCGSLIIEDQGQYYNRFVFVYPDGNWLHYDKKHLFSMAGENKAYASGKAQVNISYKGWLIQPMICYDLRFPVWCRNTQEAHIQIYVANWPKPRIAQWQKLLPARAIENQCYVIGCNRVGHDSNGLEYIGQSAVYDARGEEQLNMGSKNGYAISTLHKPELEELRKSLPFLSDRDGFWIEQ